ncbi:hypothetical protein HPB50_022990 [Hyalomma asiaticum]|uniref:Uncharacterized protein n=1 Tax=Hyalomma asiaticum TaxID=266040 RepID=A0ACB7SZC9_HYAAI|nr:hypothetical protein HPB50_022990 [Hyalomma asiaticum]
MRTTLCLSCLAQVQCRKLYAVETTMADATDFHPVLNDLGYSAGISAANAPPYPLLPCTAASGSPCRIFYHLSALNEVLFPVQLELQEVLSPCAQLSLTSFADKGLEAIHDSEKTKRAVFLLDQLLRTHSCIQNLRVKGSGAKLLVEVLKANASLKELSVHGSVICESGPHEFAQYLKVNTSLTTLSILEDDTSDTSCFEWMAEGLLVNKTIEKVNLTNISFDRENAKLVARIFAENKVIRSFNTFYNPQSLSHLVSADCGMWHEPISNNETLEELSFPIFIWNFAQWNNFFRTASRKVNLKKIAVFVHTAAFPCVCSFFDVLRESGAEEKVSFGSCYLLDNVDWITSKAFSDFNVYSYGQQLTWLAQLLTSCAHVTSMRFNISMDDLSSVSPVSACIQAATSLQKLDLALYNGHRGTQDKQPWSQLAETLRQKTSLREITVDVFRDVAPAQCRDQIRRLSGALSSHESLRRVHFRAAHSIELAAFLRNFAERVTDNYILLGVTLNGRLETEAVPDYIVIRDVARRNCGLVRRATNFTKGLRVDRCTAGALEQVWRHAGLLEELADQQSLSMTEATSMVRSALRSIEGLHDFMRITNVVKDSVVCKPRPDGRLQLDALNEDCWRLVRRYLAVDDVVESI